jgi:hypothetical protein
MSSLLPPDFLNLLDFSTEFLVDIDFVAKFDFGGDFAPFFANERDVSTGTGLYDYDGVSCEFSVEGSVQHR